MKNAFRFLFYTLISVVFVAFIVFISYFVSFYKTINLINLGNFVLKELSIVGFISILSFVFPFLVFYLRTNLSVKFYFVKSELNKNTKKVLLFLDIIFSVLLSLLIVFNIKYFYFSFTLSDNFRLLDKVSDFPFALVSLKIFLVYLLIVLIYTILPILVFSHRGYILRFLFFKVIPHKLSSFTSIYLFLLGLYFGLFVLIYSVIKGIELYPNYSIIISVGILTSLVIFVYSIILLIRLLTLREIKWFENIIFVVFVLLFFIVSFLPKEVQSVSMFKLGFVEDFHSNLRNSKYALKLSKFDVSQVFDKVSVDDLRNLLNLKIKEYNLSSTPLSPVEVIRKLSAIERIPYLINTRLIDKAFQKDLIMTNTINVEDLLKSTLIGSIVNSFSVSNTNYIEVSSYYRFLGVDLFYKRYIITYSLGNDLKIYNVFGRFDKVVPSSILSTKDKFLINLVVANKGFELFFVEDGRGYYVVSSYKSMIILSNENYISFTTTEGYDDEHLLFLKGQLLFVSNINLSGKNVGVKVRYFHIDGIGGDINEAITNLVSNADYYYKVIQLTNKIEHLRDYLDRNPDNLPPDIIDKLKRFILN